jgi:hypothetical protein
MNDPKTEYVEAVRNNPGLGEIPAKSLECFLKREQSRLRGCGPRQVELIRSIGDRLGWILPKEL